MDFEISVKDLLKTKYLRNITRVVAGKTGLNKIVRWVHILEVRDVVNECVDGNEMVLTTGIGFTTKDTALRFFKELINQGVTALCIETALYYHKIDQELIDLADEHNIPLIEITAISRFMDITKGLNTLIINNESNLFQEADHYDNQLNQYKGTILDGIKYTADYLDLEVCYFPMKGRPIAAQEITGSEGYSIDKLYKLLDEEEDYYKSNLAIKSIKILGKVWGYLVFKSLKRNITQYETIILNRLSNKIKNDLYSELIKKEEKIHEKNDWIKKWLEGSLSEVVIKSNIRNYCSSNSFHEFIVCTTELPIKEELKISYRDSNRKLFNDLLLHTTAIVRRVFEDQGLSILAFMDNTLSYIIMIPVNMKDLWTRVENAVNELSSYSDEFIDYTRSMFSFGKKVNNVLDIKKSYETSLEYLDNTTGKEIGLNIYDKMYIKRIIEKIKSELFLHEFIKDHLGSLLEESNSELLHTLKTYYESNCSKQRTSDILYIARQTLYFRLRKIEEILGSDFDKDEKKVAIEFAIHAYFSLNAKNLF